MRILVTGGAGYVGSHAVRHLRHAGHQVWIYDNLSCGHAAAALDTPLILGELSDTQKLVDLLRSQQVEAVMHFAAFALVGESVTNPSKYYENNVVGSLRLLQAMHGADVRKIVFSSTTATYGEPAKSPIAETTLQQPINPYGFSKLMVEQILDDFAAAYGFGFAALRYFNASGAAADGLIGEDHRPESHLIPIVLQVALGQRDRVTIFGDDYPTPDGTCIRDYIHVDDLAEAHLRALDRLQPGKGLKLNLGSGTGYSVQQVIDVCRQVTGHPIPAMMGARRAGDPPALVADSSLAQRTLDWQCRYSDLPTIVASAWNWHQAHPRGYA
ncbi:UDP-glucose 4-epimerase [Anatilimnocola aggregata]|uniref:UDP-glucose 4-epimerase n=1 Tax=Anatilimnocola aggregata TaxID=2528021 RepID=A0A517YNY0_9BACT|nr:UDP-glucose 4-epimerase GalE [Anatilimnocola aggregata]QDU31932.1 UDP-glucose 4-epimerase [Anatilimnocola aggregata]